MSKADYAALIALCAALASAIGDVIRQRSAQEITDEPVGHLELFWLSVRDSRWWLGGMGAVADAIAAASVTRASSSARFLFGACSAGSGAPGMLVTSSAAVIVMNPLHPGAVRQIFEPAGRVERGSCLARPYPFDYSCFTRKRAH